MTKSQTTNAAILEDNEDDFGPTAKAVVDTKAVEANNQQAEAFIEESKSVSPTLVESDAPVQVEALEETAQEEIDAEQQEAEAQLDAALEVEAAHDEAGEVEVEDEPMPRFETQEEFEAAEERALQEANTTTAEIEAFQERMMQEPVEVEMGEDCEESDMQYASEVLGLMDNPMRSEEVSHNNALVYIILSLAALGIRVRNIASKNLNHVFSEQYVNEAAITLNARLPKALLSSEKPFLRSLVSLTNKVTGRDGLQFNLAMLVAPKDKRMKQVGDLETAYEAGQVVDLVDYLTEGGSTDAILGHDITILVSNNNSGLLTFKGIGDANIPNFSYLENSLDLIAPSLSTVATYVEFLSKSGVPVRIDPNNTYSAYAEPKEVSITPEDSTVGYNTVVEIFQERYNLKLMELGKPLNSVIKVNPLFLGTKLLNRANTLDGVEINRFDLCSVALVEDSNNNWSFMGATEYDLTIEFHQSLHIDAPIDDVEDEEEDEE